MELFKLKFDLNLKITGAYPQIQKFIKGYDSEKVTSCSQVGSMFFSKLPNVSLDFKCLELAKKAKLTDYMSCSYLNELTGLLVSDSFRNFLMKFNLPNSMKYEASIYQNGDILSSNYCWMHYTSTYPEAIQFDASEFFLDHPEANYKKIEIASYNDFKSAETKFPYFINSKRLVLNSKFITRFDLIRIGVIHHETFVNEKLKDNIIGEKFTGIDFEKINCLEFN